MKGGLDIVTGGTDTHLMLVDLRPKGVTGKDAEAALGRAHITCNKNGIPFDPQPPTVTSGVRLGTPAGTTRGFGAAEFAEIGAMIVEVLDGLAANGPDGNAAVEAAVKARSRRSATASRSIPASEPGRRSATARSSGHTARRLPRARRHSAARTAHRDNVSAGRRCAVPTPLRPASASRPAVDAVAATAHACRLSAVDGAGRGQPGALAPAWQTGGPGRAPASPSRAGARRRRPGRRSHWTARPSRAAELAGQGPLVGRCKQRREARRTAALIDPLLRTMPARRRTQAGGSCVRNCPAGPRKGRLGAVEAHLDVGAGRRLDHPELRARLARRHQPAGALLAARRPSPATSCPASPRRPSASPRASAATCRGWSRTGTSAAPAGSPPRRCAPSPTARSAPSARFISLAPR